MRRFVPCLLMFFLCAVADGSTTSITWPSTTTGTTLTGEVRGPAASDNPLPTVVYLKNLSVPRIGTDADESIIEDLIKSGHVVIVLDYSHHPKTVSPDLNADVLKLRRDIGDAKNRTVRMNYKVDINRLFILMEGFRLKRDVEFARDGDRVLAMDICYPSNPKQPVPTLMEITCDNTNRMGSFSLLFCHDTLLEGAQAAGFATAMVDHPVAPPYKGLDDPMQKCIERMNSAVKVLRAFSGESKTNFANGHIGAIGFSRGGPFAAILAVTKQVDASLIHGNRYDYLDLLPTDPMLARFEKAWGPRGSNSEKWAAHGASFYLDISAAPMFLNTSAAESPEYRDGLAKFDKRLTEAGIEHVYQLDSDDRGHRVTEDPKTLSKIYDFFHAQLDK